MKRLLIVAIGGALGALARHGLSSLIAGRLITPFPLGTWVINISGSFIIGGFLTVFSKGEMLHPDWRLLIVVGFIGAYTTFSTFEFETLHLIQTGRPGLAMIYVTSSVSLGLLAVWAGMILAKRLLL
jgi:fluoride exporter